MEPALAKRLIGINRRLVMLGYLGVVALFVFVVSRFYDPVAGFNYLIAFGGKQNLPQISELKELNYFYQAKGYGYDAQYYAQIAMHPSLREPQLHQAIDNLPYRARRILSGWIAYAMGLGKPAWILQAFAVQNIIIWLVLAAVLLRWFPPNSWSNLLRWAGVLFGVGISQSLRLALVDGPSLLLIAIGVWCVERNRRWLATAVFAISGLARETNLLAGVALVRPDARNWRHLGELCIRAMCVAAPLVLWLVYIHAVVGPSVDVGARNFSFPLHSFLSRWSEAVNALIKLGVADSGARGGLLVLISLAAQFCFLAFRPRPGETWWRVGACFGLLMLILGDAVWEGYPGAAPRVLLPMQLAFNVLVPRGRKWLMILLLGNLSLIAAPDFLEAIPGHGYRLRGPSSLRTSANGLESARVIFDENWYDTEQRNDRYWRWAGGDATFTVVNPHSKPVIASVRFHLDGIDQRQASVLLAGRPLWTGAIGMDEPEIKFPEVQLLPGKNVFTIKTDQPPKVVGGELTRTIVCSLRNLEIRFLRFAP